VGEGFINQFEVTPYHLLWLAVNRYHHCVIVEWTLRHKHGGIDDIYLVLSENLPLEQERLSSHGSAILVFALTL
jgi:hypothetical protein